jgi:uncharacterized protein YggE
MKTTSKLALGAALLMALPQAVFAQREEIVTIRTSEVKVDPAKPIIDLAVTSTVQSAPDAATFTTGVQTKAPKARDAITKNAEKMAAVVAQLKAAGIADKDIQTSAISLYRDVEYLPTGKQRLKGYVVSNVVTAKLRDFQRLGDVLDMLATNGATEFSGPNFTLDDDSAAAGQARDAAWARAMKQARYHAQKAGYADVRVVRVGESIRQQAVEEPMAYAKMAVEAAAEASASTPIQGGEIGTSVTLAITFEMTR